MINQRKTGLGGNIPIDLAMEHYIRIVKLLKRKLGSNQNNKQTLRQYMKALGFTKVLLEDFDESTCIIQQSGRHTNRSSAKDKAKIVEELVKARAFVRQAESAMFLRISNQVCLPILTTTVFTTG